MTVFLLSEKIAFPPPTLADKDGLLAVGGDLRIERLLLAYRNGIFPWYSAGQPILWWSPDPRLVLYPSEVRISRSLKRVIRKRRFRISSDTAFEKIIRECASVRLEQNEGTWLTEEMIDAYCGLHAAGLAHSMEVWLDDALAGGLYGVSLGRCFFGESMFTRITDGSKIALAALAKHLEAASFHMIDCQLSTEHLIRFGAREISRRRFLRQLKNSLSYPTRRGSWTFDEETLECLVAAG